MPAHLTRIIFREFSEKSLEELEKEKVLVVLSLERNESDREFHLAIAKTAPYLMITLLTTTLVSFATKLLEASIAGMDAIGVSLMLILLMIFALFLHSRGEIAGSNKQITEDKIAKEEIDRLIGERLTSLKPALDKYRESIENSQLKDWKGLFFAQNPQLITAEEVISVVRPDRRQDIEHRYPGLLDSIRKMDSTDKILVDTTIQFRKIVESMVTETKNLRLQDPPDKLNGIVLAIQRIASGSITSEMTLTQARRTETFMGQEGLWLGKMLVENRTDEPSISLLRIAENSEVRDLAKKVDSLQCEGNSQRQDILTRILNILQR